MSGRFILQEKIPVVCKDLYEWGRYFESADHIVAKTNISEDVRVSTVFLGLDHGFGGGPPLLFETIIFGGSLDQEMDRYSTWDEAEGGHACMVERARTALHADVANAP